MSHTITREVIEDRLQQFALANNVRVLHAVESGSRGWGFPSLDSDWDCRFIYVRNRQDYLSTKAFPNELIYKDTEFGGDVDMEGWDLRKVLQLSIVGNAVVHEWIQSPIVYGGGVQGFRESFLESISKPLFRLSGALNNYVGIAQTARTVPAPFGGYCFDLRTAPRTPEEQHLHDLSVRKQKLRQCTPKKLFYYIRAVLAMTWCKTKESLPPMDLSSLLAGGFVPPELIEEILVLRGAKLLLGEKASPLAISDSLCIWLIDAEISAEAFYRAIPHKELVRTWSDSLEDRQRVDDFFCTFIMNNPVRNSRITN